MSIRVYCFSQLWLTTLFVCDSTGKLQRTHKTLQAGATLCFVFQCGGYATPGPCQRAEQAGKAEQLLPAPEQAQQDLPAQPWHLRGALRLSQVHLISGLTYSSNCLGMDSSSLSAVWGSVPGTSPRLPEPAASSRRGLCICIPAPQESWGVMDNIRIFSWNWFLVSSSDLIYELDWTWTKFTCVSKEYLKIPFRSSYAERWTEQLWVRCIPAITDCFHCWPPGSRLSKGWQGGGFGHLLVV